MGGTAWVGCISTVAVKVTVLTQAAEAGSEDVEHHLTVG